jgi:preprotein translocase subunit Sec61beta
MYPAFKIRDSATQAELQLKATVELLPDAFLPEFVDAQNSIRQKFENKNMAVEKAADELIDFFNEYEPKGLKIRVDVINNNMFFPVAVTAESGLISSVEADEKRAGKKNTAEKTSVKEEKDKEQTRAEK